MLKRYINLSAFIEPYLKRFPLHPNTLTFFSLIFAALGFFFPLAFLLAILLDALDGALARAKGLSSPFGAFIDGISDRLVEFAMISYFISTHGYIAYALFLLFFGTLMTSFAKAYSHYRQCLSLKEIDKLTTIMGREERAFLIFLSLFYPPLIIPTAFLSIITFFYLLFQVVSKCRAKP